MSSSKDELPQKIKFNTDNFGRIYVEILLDKELSAYAKLCYGVMTSFGPTENGCYATAQTIADRMGVKDIRTVKDAQEELQIAGWIRLESFEQGTSKVWHVLDITEFRIVEAQDAGGKMETPASHAETPPHEMRPKQEEDLKQEYKTNKTLSETKTKIVLKGNPERRTFPQEFPDNLFTSQFLRDASQAYQEAYGDPLLPTAQDISSYHRLRERDVSYDKILAAFKNRVTNKWRNDHIGRVTLREFEKNMEQFLPTKKETPDAEKPGWEKNLDALRKRRDEHAV